MTSSAFTSARALIKAKKTSESAGGEKGKREKGGRMKKSRVRAKRKANIVRLGGRARARLKFRCAKSLCKLAARRKRGGAGDTGRGKWRRAEQEKKRIV